MSLKTRRQLTLERAVTVYRQNVENDLQFWAHGRHVVSVWEAVPPAVAVTADEHGMMQYEYTLVFEFNETIKDWIYRVYCMDACLIEGAVRDLPEQAGWYARKLIQKHEERKEIA